MSKMIKCKTCGADIASSAKNCPSCGAKNKKPIYKKVWFWIIVFIIAVGAIGGGSSSSSSSSDKQSSSVDAVANNNQEENKTQEVKEDVIVVSAEELAKAFEDNEVSANKTYRDKTVEITGKVDSIGEVLGSTYITLAASEEFAITQVQCTFKDNDQIDKVAELSKGDTVTVIGKVEGKSMNVTVNDCKFK